MSLKFFKTAAEDGIHKQEIEIFNEYGFLLGAVENPWILGYYRLCAGYFDDHTKVFLSKTSNVEIKKIWVCQQDSKMIRIVPINNWQSDKSDDETTCIAENILAEIKQLKPAMETNSIIYLLVKSEIYPIEAIDGFSIIKPPKGENSLDDSLAKVVKGFKDVY